MKHAGSVKSPDDRNSAGYHTEREPTPQSISRQRTPVVPSSVADRSRVEFSAACSPTWGQLRICATRDSTQQDMGIDLPYKLPLPYSRELCREYEEVATAVRDQVFEVYEQYLRGELHLDPSKWKLVKKREKVKIYYSRQKFPPSALHRPLEPTVASPEVREQSDWMPMVKLVVTGTTLGTMEDAMYGAASPTQESMLMKSMTVRDDFYHHRTLKDITIPTVDDPFKYVGLKWSCRSPYVASLIKARDMVYIESNGFREVFHNGEYERVGYTLYHSVELPDVPPLESQGILRSKYSAIVLYRQAAPGVVEVFNTTSLFPNGELMFKVTAFQAAEALIAVCKVTESAMKKKLVWMQAARAYGAPNATSGFLQTWHAPRPSFSEKFSTRVNCVQCSRSLSALRSLTSCEICATQVCSRCITSRKLVLGHKMDELVYKPVIICKGCIHTAQNMNNAPALAVYEFVQPFDRVRSQFEEPETNLKRPTPHRQSSTASTERSVSSVDGPQPPRPTMLYTNQDISSTGAGEDVIGVEPDHTSTPTTKRFSDEATAEKLRLWRQINELCLQAEETYRLAVRQTQNVIQERELF